MQQFSNVEIAEIKSRIDQIQEMLGSGAGGQVPVVSQPDRIDAPVPGLIEQLNFSLQMRRTRKSHFGSNQLTGPTWDMLLDLMLAKTNDRELSASDLATGAGVPLSSGLRMIALLEHLDLAERFIDERDRRRSIVRLTDNGVDSMTRYFEKMGHAWNSRRRLAM
ncbi:MarR family transcriptional regulator [Sphingopyxis sp. Root1497]|uniref:winged helix DNA-binding protein n=1 Tax=Sphingopyxis sp. Root1497 TaxID=1736474 RepID=UPI0006F66AB6|nr:winged helix DNA-binding protein [Sphingopyxis sp. Root1497]KQZ60807.1 MarR family transcriptional regulator [Sphingopyxis sp. Root1497]